MASRHNYGHFGRAKYSERSRRWSFGRDHNADSVCIPLGDPVSIIDGTPHGPSHHVRGVADQSVLFKHCPDLRPTPVALLKGLNRESARVHASSAVADGTREALAIGQIAVTRDEDKLSGDTIQVIALPGGSDHSILRVALFDDKQASSNAKHDPNVTLPRAALEIGYWAGAAEPILQIVFARNTQNRGSLLAVRLPSQTLIFRPLWHDKRRRPAGAYLGCPLPPSRLEVRPILALPVSQTGGSPHVDVCFDPQDQRQFAVNDSDGNWTVFKLFGKQYARRLTYQAAPIHSGRFVDSKMQSDSGNDRPFEVGEVVPDGSESSTQVHNKSRCIFHTNGLLLTGQNTLQIVELDTPNPSAALIRGDFLSNSVSLLDAAEYPERPDCVILLSSSQVACVRIWKENDVFQSETMVAWPHYRDQNDQSLTLRCCIVKSTLSILVFSSLSSTATVFGCTHTEPTGDHVIVRDPVKLYVSLNTLTTLFSVSLPRASESGRHDTLIRLLHLNDDLCVSVQYFVTVPATAQQPLQLPSVLRNAGKGWYRALRNFLSDTFVYHDDFLVPYGFDDESGKTLTEQKLPTGFWISLRNINSQDQSTMRGQRVVMNHLDSLYDPRAKSPRDKQLDGTRNLQTLLAASETAAKFDERGTLYELADPDGALLDLEGLQTALDGHLDLESSGCLTTLPVYPTAVTRFMSRPTLSNVPALQIYDEVVAKWISCLPHAAAVSYRTRLSMLASKIAYEISLASWLLRPPLASRLDQGGSVSPSKGKQPAAFTEAEDRPLDQDRCSISQASALDPNGQDSVAIPLTPATTLSLASGSSYASRGPNAADTAYERLSRLTEFVSRPGLMPPRMGRVLNHWETGADPGLYDWSNVRRSFEADRGRTLSRRAERRARRHLERQRREAERASQRTTPSISEGLQSAPRVLQSRSSPIPEIVRPTASQVGAVDARREADNLQTHGPEPVIASQVERGLFGDRSRGRLRKKPRMAGF